VLVVLISGTKLGIILHYGPHSSHTPAHGIHKGMVQLQLSLTSSVVVI